jgi:hypothetical protein
MDEKVTEPDFSVGDLLTEICKELGIEPGNRRDETGLYTMKELCQLTGVGEWRMYKLLYKFKEAGLVDDTQKKTTRKRLGLGITTVQAYSFRRMQGD